MGNHDNGVETPMSQSECAPKVSVCVITYNHEKYIGECVQSILSQQTDFDFEVIVGDDCSTDRTMNLLTELMIANPAKLIVFSQNKNTGGTKNYYDVHRRARGTYVAHMDGDDVMSPGKLQAQADFLDNHPDCSFAVHDMYTMDGNGIRLSEVQESPAVPQRIEAKDLVKNYLTFNHSSKMYRKKFFYDYHETDDVIDFTMHIEHAAHGWIGFLRQNLGGYRVTSGGISKAQGERLWRLIEYTLRGFARARELGYNIADVDYGEAMYALRAAIYCLERGDSVGFQRFLDRSITTKYPISTAQVGIRLLRNLVWALYPLTRIRRLFLKR